MERSTAQTVILPVRQSANADRLTAARQAHPAAPRSIQGPDHRTGSALLNG